MRIIFVRHGHHINDCLTPLGNKQAAAAAQRLQEEGIQKIFSSTRRRAYETAEYTANQFGISMEKCDFMQEIGWGSLDKPLYTDGSPWTATDDMVDDNESLLCQDWMKKQPFYNNRVVDYVQEVAEATDVWLQKLGYSREGNYYRVIGDTEKTIAVFGHGGASSAILSHLFNLPFPFVCATIRPDYTSITIVELSNEKGSLVTPRFEILNDDRHIQKFKTMNTYEG